MNQNKLSKLSNSCGFDSNANGDFQKLIHICNSYGLNQQQTNQLIDQFKKGSLFSPQRSFNDSLNQSMTDMDQIDKHQEQEYSFKHHPKQSIHEQTQRSSYPPKPSPSIQERYSNRSRNQYKEQSNFSFEHLQKMLTEKFTIEKGLVKNLQEENNRLKNQMQEKQRQISRLTEMKGQETEIIMGLKDIISNLTLTLKEKQANFRQIQEKYNHLMESKVRQLSSRPSMTQISECQVQDTTNLYQNSMRESSCNKKSLKKLNEQKENKQQYGYDKKRSNRIDVKKYKEMIQNLRSNC